MLNIFLALVLLLAIVLLFYLLRKKVKFTFFDKRISAFEQDIKIYLRQNYPKIPFDLTVFQESTKEKNMSVRQMLIAENLSMQFVKYPYEFDTQPAVERKYLWSTYEFESKPSNNKRPNDLKRRKELAYKRDQKACIRCGLSLSMNDATLATIKPYGQNGTYHFENLATLCKDCYKILKESNPANIAQDTKILNDIIKKIHHS